MDAHDRASAWCDWHGNYRREVGKLGGHKMPPELRYFAVHHYAANYPQIIKLPPWRALQWTPASLRASIGNAEVEVQAGRADDAEFEIRALAHRTRMPFHAFMDAVEHGRENDVYMTANNAAGNRAALEPLVEDMTPLPPFLTNDPRSGFLWIGGRTLTPMHHDLTNNLMAQCYGEKLVRMVSPLQTPLLGERIHVHTKLGWLEDAVALERGIQPLDALLRPGDALFLPLGWWHCVRTPGPAVTAVFTNFVFANSWSAGFPS